MTHLSISSIIIYSIIVGEKGIDNGTVEYKARDSEDVVHWKMDEVLTQLKKQ